MQYGGARRWMTVRYAMVLDGVRRRRHGSYHIIPAITALLQCQNGQLSERPNLQPLGRSGAGLLGQARGGAAGPHGRRAQRRQLQTARERQADQEQNLAKMHPDRSEVLVGVVPACCPHRTPLGDRRGLPRQAW